MNFITRFINKRISNTFSRFIVPTKDVEQFENDYPHKGIGDHHRFLL